MDYHSRSRQPIRTTVEALAGTTLSDTPALENSAAGGQLPGEFGQDDQPPSIAAHCARRSAATAVIS